MPSVINSTSVSPGGLVTTGDTDNELVIQTNGTTAISVDASQNVAITGNFSFNGGQEAVSTGKAIAMAIVFGG